MQNAKTQLITKKTAGMTSALRQTAQCKTIDQSSILCNPKTFVIDLYIKEKDGFKCIKT